MKQPLSYKTRPQIAGGFRVVHKVILIPAFFTVAILIMIFLAANVEKDLKVALVNSEEAVADLRERLNESAPVLEPTATTAEDVIADADRSIGNAVIIGSVLAVAGVLLSIVIGRGIALPLEEIAARARRVSAGDLTGEPLPIRTSDELGLVAQAFNDMVDELKEVSQQIFSVTSELNSAATQVLASTQQQATSTKEQAATVVEISTTMQEISRSGSEIGDKAKQVASVAAATSGAGEDGLRAMQQLSRTMELIREQIEEVAERIVALSEKTQAIGETVTTVNEIAEQSNLLALNAAIEAASAGEKGNRFAVVANEMKNLADRAKEGTVHVRTILGDIQKGINSSVMLTEEAVKRAESGKSQADSTEMTIKRLTDSTVESLHAFQQIIGATNQQQIGFDQVTQGMQDIRQAAEQTAIGTSQLEAALSNLNELGGQLRDAAGRYRL